MSMGVIFNLRPCRSCTQAGCISRQFPLWSDRHFGQKHHLELACFSRGLRAAQTPCSHWPPYVPHNPPAPVPFVFHPATAPHHLSLPGQLWLPSATPMPLFLFLLHPPPFHSLPLFLPAITYYMFPHTVHSYCLIYFSTCFGPFNRMQTAF